jgi:hypothetical protein
VGFGEGFWDVKRKRSARAWEFMIGVGKWQRGRECAYALIVESGGWEFTGSRWTKMACLVL